MTSMLLFGVFVLTYLPCFVFFRLSKARALRILITGLSLAALLGGTGRADVTMSRTSEGSHNTVGVGASVPFSTETSTAPAAKTHEPHYQPMRATQDSPAIQKSVSQAGGTDTRTGTTDAKKTSPGNTDGLKGNDAGKFNMGSPDHIPGTSGTSGQ